MKPVVVLQYLSLIHYRRSVFDHLFEDDRLDFKIVCGSSSPYSAMKNYTPNIDQDVSFVENIRLLGTRVLVQRGMISATNQKNPDVVIILGVNPLIVSSLISAIFFSKVKKVKVFWWGHGTFGRQGWAGRFFRKQFYKLSDGILVYGEGGKANLIANGISSEKIHVVNNCLNKEDYGDAYVSEKQKEFKILFVGRLTVQKRVDELIKLGGLLKERGLDMKIDILGEGPDLERLKSQVFAHGLENNVFLHGAKYGVEAHEFFREASLFVHPGAIGLSVIHALSFGLPVITSNDGARLKPEMEAIVEDENGSFYAAGDMKALVEKTLAWKERIEVSRPAVVQFCQESIVDYTPDAVANRIITPVID